MIEFNGSPEGKYLGSELARALPLGASIAQGLKAVVNAIFATTHFIGQALRVDASCLCWRRSDQRRPIHYRRRTSLRSLRHSN